jgi:hypothetical protein
MLDGIMVTVLRRNYIPQVNVNTRMLEPFVVQPWEKSMIT